MKKIAPVFLFSAFLFMLAHNGVPHDHQPATGQYFYTNHSHPNILEILKCAFSRDLGENHLNECTMQGKFNFAKADFITSGFAIHSHIRLIKPVLACFRQELMIKVFLYKCGYLRAPPFAPQ